MNITEKEASAAAQVLKNMLAVGIGGAAGTAAGYGVRSLLRRAAAKELITGVPGIGKWLPLLGGATGLLGGTLAAVHAAKERKSRELLEQAHQKQGSPFFPPTPATLAAAALPGGLIGALAGTHGGEGSKARRALQGAVPGAAIGLTIPATLLAAHEGHVPVKVIAPMLGASLLATYLIGRGAGSVGRGDSSKRVLQRVQQDKDYSDRLRALLGTSA